MLRGRGPRSTALTSLRTPGAGTGWVGGQMVGLRRLLEGVKAANPQLGGGDRLRTAAVETKALGLADYLWLLPGGRYVPAARPCSRL